MAKGKPKSINLTDKSGLVDELISRLSKSGTVRLVHFGLFRVAEIKGKKRYDFRKRQIVPAKPYKIITFKPARGIHEMLGKGKMAAD